MELFFLLICILQISLVIGHGYLKCPSPEFKPGTRSKGGMAAHIMDKDIFPSLKLKNQKSKSDRDHNLAAFHKLFNNGKNGKYKTVRELVDAFRPDCANTDEKVAPRNVSECAPKNHFIFGNELGGHIIGFQKHHIGPCEAWIDDKRVFYDADCITNFQSKPGQYAKIPIDYSSCKGNCVFRFYWAALHFQKVQMFSK